MTSSDKKVLCELIDSKIDLLEEYETAIKPIPEIEFSEIGKCLDKRTEIMDKLTKLTRKETELIAAQSEKDELMRIFRLENLDKIYSGDTEELAVKLRAQNILYSRIQTIERDIEKRFREEKSQLDKELMNVSKTKQVIDYMEQTAKPIIFNGRSFDKSQ